MRSPVFLVMLVCIVAGVPDTGSVAFAQSTAAEMLEKARARSRDMEELKSVLNGPDQNMRLATFDVMVNSDDDAMRQIAIDAGLASADPLLQSMAFKSVVLGMERITLSLEIDKSQPKELQEAAQKYLASKGDVYHIPIIGTDHDSGVFTIYSSYTGQINGLELNFKYNHDLGTLSLVDEATMKGPIKVYSGGYCGFIATARLR